MYNKSIFYIYKIHTYTLTYTSAASIQQGAENYCRLSFLCVYITGAKSFYFNRNVTRHRIWWPYTHYWHWCAIMLTLQPRSDGPLGVTSANRSGRGDDDDDNDNYDEDDIRLIIKERRVFFFYLFFFSIIANDPPDNVFTLCVYTHGRCKRAREKERVRGWDSERGWCRKDIIIIIIIIHMFTIISLYIYILYYTTIVGNIMSPAENYCDWFVCMKTMSCI